MIINTIKLHARNLILLFLLCNYVRSQNEVNSILTEANVKIPSVYPIPKSVEGVNNPTLSLNGTWKVAIDQGVEKPIQVPGELIMQGFDFSIGETAHYQKTLEIPKDWLNKRVFIRFDAVSSYALVKLNGTTVGEHEGSFVPFQFEITDYIKNKDNVLQVDVRAHTISDILACTSQYAAHTVAGILRKVTLFVLPETHISDITINTLFDKKFQNATLNIESKIESLANDNDPSELQLHYVLAKGDKKVVQKTIPVTAGSSESSIKVRKPHQWNPESPYLYDLRTDLIKNGRIIQTNNQKIGFRQVEIKGSQVYVNGNPIKLHGVNRHIVHPLTGRSLSPEFDVLDAKLFKEANCNYIRTSHYPPSEEFLKAADSIGLFVESEASLTWVKHGASPIWGNWDYLDERFLPYMLTANIENVQAYKNHPSVIIWSLANESRWSPLWDKVKQVVKQMDPNRPTAFHDQCWGGFNNAGSTADIGNYHYPGIDGPKATDTVSRPILFGEYSHLSTYNRRELFTDPGVRDAYNLPLVTFYDSIYAHPNNLGGAIWSGIDDTFHLPDGRIVGYGPWGPLDGWRRKKPEYYGMKKAYSPVRVKKVAQKKGKLLVELENRYDFTSLSNINIVAEINGVKITLRSKIAHRQKGVIEIPVKEKLKTFKISFYDPNGFIADEEFYSFNEETDVATANNRELFFTENKDSYLVVQGQIRYRISKITGTIVSVKKGEQPVLSEGPLFTLVPLNSENGGKNHIAGETYQRVIHPLQNFPWYVKFANNITLEETTDAIRISANITYKEGKGKIDYTFSKNGKFITDYEIEDASKNGSSPYQYGMMLQLPKTFKNLSWKRKGDFSSYPKDHIGRNIGTTKLNAKKTTGVEPWREKPNHAWKDDANELGSNDFKSTKRNIYQASLTADNGTKVTVLSNGKQASRTWLQEEHINWLIADYSNNGSERFYGTPHSNGRITTKDKVLKGTLKLNIE